MNAPANQKVQIVLPKEYSNGVLTFEADSLSQSEQVRSIKIADQDSYNLAVETGRTIATFEDGIERWFDRFINGDEIISGGLRSLLDEIYAAKRSIMSLIKADKDYLGLEVGRWDREQARIKSERDRIAREEERKRQEEANLAAAVQAEASGMPEKAITQLLERPISSLPPSAPPTFTKAAGVSGRENWAAYPVDDDSVAALKALVKAAASDDQWLPYLMTNVSALNQRAKAEKTAFRVPGHVALSTAKGAFRKV